MNHEFSERKRSIRPAIILAAGTAGLLLAGILAWNIGRSPDLPEDGAGYAAHQGVTTTMFWVGEEANESNGYIHNNSSAWTENWVEAFGGVDSPEPRCNLLPCAFSPQENPFYFALPYNDLDENCGHKPSQTAVPWYEKPPADGESIIKNQWIKVTYEGKTVYAQWQDAGPFGEDDTDYVFGTDGPNADAGLDISPAAAGYLGLDGHGQTDWQFVAEQDVPDGPWRKTITRSGADCAS